MNKLTEKLLAEGYTKDNPPENMYWDHSDFKYHYWYMAEKTFKTPCGLQCQGKTCHCGMSYMGIEWGYEDDMAAIHCPYDKAECRLKHEYLQVDGTLRFWCNVHRVDEDYQYEGSVEGELKLHDEEIRRKLLSEKLRRNGRVCEDQAFFNRDTQEWEFRYDPGFCARGFCRATADLGQGFCPVLGRPLDTKKGNVFYDVKITQTDHSKDGTFWEGDTITTIEKGKRAFTRNVSMDICRNYVKLNRDDLIRSVKIDKYHADLFFAEYHGRVFEVEILNIRAEQRVSRDLEQDLRDIADGVKISYEDDLIKQRNLDKKKRREDRRDKRRKKIEKIVITRGWDALDFSDCKFVEKYMSDTEEDDLTKKHLAHLAESNKIVPKQYTIFDFLDQGV